MTGRIAWTRDSVAGVPLRRSVGRVGEIEVGSVDYDGSNRFWIWATPLKEDAWGYGVTEEAAQAGLEAWLREWLGNFRGFFENPPPSAGEGAPRRGAGEGP